LCKYAARYFVTGFIIIIPPAQLKTDFCFDLKSWILWQQHMLAGTRKLSLVKRVTAAGMTGAERRTLVQIANTKLFKFELGYNSRLGNAFVSLRMVAGLVSLCLVQEEIVHNKWTLTLTHRGSRIIEEMKAEGYPT
jgi:hypothetical protein